MDISYPRTSENSSMKIDLTSLLKIFASSFFWLTLSNKKALQQMLKGFSVVSLLETEFLEIPIEGEFKCSKS